MPPEFPLAACAPARILAAMRTCFHAIVCLLTLALWAAPSARTMVRLYGDIPAGMDARYLEEQFTRVCRQVAPHSGCGREPVRVLFYRAASQPRLSLRLPEWGGGGALSPDSVIIPVDKPFVLNYELPRVVVHELVHCALMRSVGDVYVPRWFHEGAAVTLAGEISFEEALALSYAVLLNRLPVLESIDTVNAISREAAALAYSYSHAIVLFMVDKWGIDVVGAIAEQTRENGSFEQGLFAALGLTTPELTVLANESIRKHYGLPYVLGDLGYIWAVVLCVAVVAFFAVRHRNRRRKAAMEREESASAAQGQPADTTVSTTPTTAQSPGPALGDVTQPVAPLPPETNEAAERAFGWAQTWRARPEDPTPCIVAVWFYGDCLLATRPKSAPLMVAVEFEPPEEDDDDEELTFERFGPLWQDSLRETLGSLLESYGGLRVVPCYADDDAFFHALEREGLLVYELEDA